MAEQIAYQKGDQVVSTVEFQGESAINYHHNVPEGTPGVVTSARSRNRVGVRYEVPGNYVIVTHLDYIKLADPERMAQMEAEREAFEASLRPQEGDILVDDPRLAWLWRKVAHLAQKKDFCREYDEVCDELGIPGRERKYDVTFFIDNLEAKTVIKATSKANAEETLQGIAPTAHDIVVGKGR